MLSVNNLECQLGGETILRRVTFDVPDGDFLGVIGPNGAGKTTLIRAVSGIIPLTAGQVLLSGKAVETMSPREIALQAACLLQDAPIDVSFTVEEVVLMGRTPHLTRFGHETEADRAVAREAMRRADVEHLKDRLITEISGGERQRALIAMCLAQEPRLLLLDEPTVHLDIAHQLAALDLLWALHRERGLTVVAVFHDLNLAAEYCHRLMLLDAGRIAALGEVEDVLTAAQINSVYGSRIQVETNPVSGRPHVILTAGGSITGDAR